MLLLYSDSNSTVLLLVLLLVLFLNYIMDELLIKVFEG